MALGTEKGPADAKERRHSGTRRRRVPELRPRPARSASPSAYEATTNPKKSAHAQKPLPARRHRRRTMLRASPRKGADYYTSLSVDEAGPKQRRSRGRLRAALVFATGSTIGAFGAFGDCCGDRAWFASLSGLGAAHAPSQAPPEIPKRPPTNRNCRFVEGQPWVLATPPEMARPPNVSLRN